jgi:hypothetical protein
MKQLFLYMLSCIFAMWHVRGSEAERIERQAVKFAHYIGGIIKVDDIASQSFPAQSSVTTLRMWLESDFEHLLDELDPALIELGRTCHYDFERIKKWCKNFIQHYASARKYPQPAHEIHARTALTRSLAQGSCHSEESEKLQGALALFHDTSMQRYLCDTMLRNIGSYCALRAAQKTPKNRSARALYHELMLEQYQAACDSHTITLQVQHHLESFLYKPSGVMHNLHTIENSNFDQPHKWFFVGDENFRGMHDKTQTSYYGSSCIYGIKNDLDKISQKVHQKSAPYTITSVEGDAHNLLVQADLKDAMSSLIVINLHRPETGFFQSTGKIFARSLNATGTILWRTTMNGQPQEACNLVHQTIPHTTTHIFNINKSLNLIAVDDTGSRLVALGKNDHEPSSQLLCNLFVFKYDNQAQKISWLTKPLTHPLSSPSLALSHAGDVYAVGGQTQQGNNMLAIGYIKDTLTPQSWRNLGPGITLEQLVFSRDGKRLFLKIKTTETQELFYSMIDPAKKDSDFTRCSAPLPKKDCCNLMTAIDPYGEYIGTYARTLNGQNIYKVVPTEHHLTQNLIPSFQKLSCRDRLALYFLHQALQESEQTPACMHISPQQWDTFSKMGLREHLMLRPRVSLTSCDNTKLYGLKRGSTKAPLKKSLSDCHAVHAAAQISGRQVI